MDGDGALESGANGGRHSSFRAVKTTESLTKGRDAAIAASGIEADLAFEDSPLLARNTTISSSGSRDGNEEGDGAPYPTWSMGKEFNGLPWYRRPSIYWMLPSQFLQTIAFGGILVPRVNLILSLICNNYFAHRSITTPGFTLSPAVLGGGSDPRCTDDDNVQSMTAKFTLAMQLLAGLFSAITSPRLGSLSDRHGRIKLYVITSVGGLANEALTILAGTFPGTVSVYWILVGSILDGITGSFTAAMAISNAYVSDCTPPSQRSVAFGWMHGCLFTGIAIGPLIAGAVTKATGNVLNVFYIAVVVHATIVLYIALVVPESLSNERQIAAREFQKTASREEESRPQLASGLWATKGLRTIATFFSYGIALFTPLKILWPTGSKSSPALRRNLILIAAVDTVQFGVTMGVASVMVLYTGKIFHWDTGDTSYFVGIIGFSRAFVLLLILPAVIRLVRGKFNPSRAERHTGCDWLDLSIIWVSLVFDVLAFAGYSMAKVGVLFILSAVVGAIGGMGSPTLQSSLTRHVPINSTGQILGAIGLLHALSRVVSPTIFNLIWAKTSGTHPQLVFICLAAIFGFTFVLSLFIKPHVYDSEQDDEPESLGTEHVVS